MDMGIETYWSQQELFFIASCALFPERVISESLVADQIYKKIFDYDEKLELLNKYASDKILKFATVQDSNGKSRYVISFIDHEKFRIKLINYLEKFRNDELVVETSKKTKQFNELQESLCKYLTKNTRSRTVINPFNIWPNWTDGYGDLYPFWEIILSLTVLSHDTKLHNIGYFSEINDINNYIDVPYAEIEIINKDILQNNDTKQNVGRFRANLILKNISSSQHDLFLEVENHGIYCLKKSLKTDLSPHALLMYLLSHRGEKISLKEARIRIESFDRVKNLSEVLRQCGFNQELKSLFFDISTKTSVQIKKDIYLSKSEIGLLNK